MKDDFLHDAKNLSAKILRDIQISKEAGAEMVVLIPHMGVEFTQYPLKFARNMVSTWFAAGADIIIGGHPHVLQPMECRTTKGRDGKTKTGYVIYSLGNFVSSDDSYWPTKKCYTSIILNITIERDEESQRTTIKEISYTPTIIHTDVVDNVNKAFTISISDLYQQAVRENNLALCQELTEANSDVLSDLHWGNASASEIRECYSFPINENITPHSVSRLFDLNYTIKRVPRLFLQPVFKILSPIYHKIRG